MSGAAISPLILLEISLTNLSSISLAPSLSGVTINLPLVKERLPFSGVLSISFFIVATSSVSALVS